jgi:hypothetical protein
VATAGASFISREGGADIHTQALPPSNFLLGTWAELYGPIPPTYKKMALHSAFQILCGRKVYFSSPLLQFPSVKFSCTNGRV